MIKDIDNQINEVLRLAGVQLNEEIIFAHKDMSHIVLYNPSKKELKDNKLLVSRVVVDDQYNFFFGDAFDFEHEDIGDIGWEKTHRRMDYKGFYKLKTNTFLFEDSWDDEEQRLEYTDMLIKILNKSTYFTTNFSDSTVMLYDCNGHEADLS